MEQREKTREELKQEEEINKQIRMIYKKMQGDYSTFFQDFHRLANFKEPCLQILKSNGMGEFRENVQPGWLEFTHSDGNIRKVYIHPRHMYKLPYGKKTFSCYVIHEDFPDSSFGDPVLTSEIFTLAIDKVKHEELLAKTKELKAQTGFRMFWVWLVLAIGAVIVAIVLFKQPSAPKVETIKIITQNATNGIGMFVLPYLTGRYKRWK